MPNSISNNIWSFLGMSGNKKNEAEDLIGKILAEFFDSASKFFGIFRYDYETIDDMIMNAMDDNNNKYQYFLNWLRNEGLDKLRVILKSNISPTDETLDFLDYRLYVLETDIENGIPEGVIESIVDSIDEIYKYVKELAVSCQHETWSFKGMEMIAVTPLSADSYGVKQEMSIASSYEIFLNQWLLDNSNLNIFGNPLNISGFSVIILEERG